MPTSPFPAAPRESGELLAGGPRYLLASRTGVAHQRRPENQGLRPNKTAANQDNRPQTGLGRSWLDVAGEHGDPSGPGPHHIPCWRRWARVASSGLTADGGSWGAAGAPLGPGCGSSLGLGGQGCGSSGARCLCRCHSLCSINAALVLLMQSEKRVTETEARRSFPSH